MLIEELPNVEQELIDAIHQGMRVAYAKAGERARRNMPFTDASVTRNATGSAPSS